MKFVAVIRSAPIDVSMHFFFVDTLSALLDCEQELKAVFFTDLAASCLSKNHPQSSIQYQIQQRYLQLRDRGVLVLCCGQAFRTLGIKASDLVEKAEFSGNLELAQYFSECAVLEF